MLNTMAGLAVSFVSNATIYNVRTVTAKMQLGGSWCNIKGIVCLTRFLVEFQETHASWMKVNSHHIGEDMAMGVGRIC
jgi:hypothetical protein